METIISKHKRVAKLLEDAAKRHYAAIYFKECGNLEKANQITVEANRNTMLASEVEDEITRQTPFYENISKNSIWNQFY